MKVNHRGAESRKKMPSNDLPGSATKVGTPGRGTNRCRPASSNAFGFLLGVLCASVVSYPARADQFTIDLVARSAKEPKAGEAVYPAKQSARAALMAGADAPVTVKWTVRSAEPTSTVKDVLVHFFVVKLDKPNQQEVPKLTKNVVVESALHMDFRPKDKTGGEITFIVANPGIYLIRVELKGIADKDGREPFAALDLIAR
jgi:hypothetical protein